MKLCSLGLAAMLITSPVYADEAMTVLQDLGSKWQTAYNNGEPAKFADLYTEDAFFSSGVLGTLKGKPQIEKAIADQIKKTPKITVHPIAAQQSGNVVWGHGEFVFDDGYRYDFDPRGASPFRAPPLNPGLVDAAGHQ